MTILSKVPVCGGGRQCGLWQRDQDKDAASGDEWGGGVPLNHSVHPDHRVHGPPKVARHTKCSLYISWIISSRWSITSTRNDIMDFFESHFIKIITFLWTIGTVCLNLKLKVINHSYSGFGISFLYLINFDTNTLDFSAYFDPVSKVSVLLPSVVVSMSFHLQVCPEESSKKSQLSFNECI